MNRVSILFVCTENICRSPMAEAIFAQKIKNAGLKRQFSVDSAGTHASQPGHRPDPRAIRVIKNAGGSVRGIRSRKVQPEDFEKFDLIIAMDRGHVEDLMAISDWPEKIHLMMDYVKGSEMAEVPDPYFGSASGFVRIYDMLDNACSGFLEHLLEARHPSF